MYTGDSILEGAVALSIYNSYVPLEFRREAGTFLKDNSSRLRDESASTSSSSTLHIESSHPLIVSSVSSFHSRLNDPGLFYPSDAHGLSMDGTPQDVTVIHHTKVASLAAKMWGSILATPSWSGGMEGEVEGGSARMRASPQSSSSSSASSSSSSSSMLSRPPSNSQPWITIPALSVEVSSHEVCPPRVFDALLQKIKFTLMMRNRAMLNVENRSYFLDSSQEDFSKLWESWADADELFHKILTHQGLLALRRRPPPSLSLR